MKQKIQENIRLGRYAERTLPFSYRNAAEGWWDHLLSGRVLFSHRTSDYAEGALGERLHAHDFYELMVASSVSGVEYVRDGAYIPLRAGLAVLTKPHSFHAVRAVGEVHYDRYILYFKDPTLLFPSADLADFTRRGDASGALFSSVGQGLLPLVEAIDAALCAPSAPYAEAEALLAVCRLFLTLSAHTTAEGDVATLPVPHYIHEIKEYIDTHFLQIRSVEELAARHFYSREHISRTFRQYYNTPIYDYVLNRRLAHCASLLAHGERVETAARLSGFSNLASFIKQFRKMYGTTPSEYRRAHTDTR